MEGLILVLQVLILSSLWSLGNDKSKWIMLIEEFFNIFFCFLFVLSVFCKLIFNYLVFYILFLLMFVSYVFKDFIQLIVMVILEILLMTILVLVDSFIVYCLFGLEIL